MHFICCAYEQHTFVLCFPLTPLPATRLNDIMDDDYVAQVLAKEARDNSQKYSAEGLGAFLPRKYVLF